MGAPVATCAGPIILNRLRERTGRGRILAWLTQRVCHAWVVERESVAFTPSLAVAVTPMSPGAGTGSQPRDASEDWTWTVKQ